MNKIISIIVPCKNESEYISSFINNIIDQTIGFDNIELIFIDNASTDNTLLQLNEAEEKYPDNIIIIPLSEDIGYGASCNIAFQYASAQYISFGITKDFLSPSFYMKMISSAENHNCDFVECHYDLAQEKNHYYSVKQSDLSGFVNLTELAEKERFINSQITSTALWNKIYKSSFLSQNNIFFSEHTLCPDLFFCYSTFIFANSYYRINEVLYHHYCSFEKIVDQNTVMSTALDFLNIYRHNLPDYNSYKELIEWIFLERYYIYPLWDTFRRIPEQAYTQYLKFKNDILSLNIDYRNNSFRKKADNTLDDIMLKIIDLNLNESELSLLVTKLLSSFKNLILIPFPDSYEATNRFHAELTIHNHNINSYNDYTPSASTISILFCRWNSVCERGIEHGFQLLGYHIESMFQYLENLYTDMNYYDELAFQIRSKKYTLVFTVDFIPIIAQCCNDLNIPYVCWMVDHPVNELYSDTIRLPWNRLFFFDRYQYEKFFPCNPDNSFYMPLACDYETLQSLTPSAAEHSLYDCDISFIGSTYEEKCAYNNISHMIPPYLSGYIDGIIHAQFNVYGYNFIEDTLSESIYNQLIQYINIPIKDKNAIRSIIADNYIGWKCTELDRKITLQNISNHFDIDLYTVSDTTSLPNVHFKGSVDYDTIMPKIFRCSKINLNMTSRTIQTGIPLRVFDIMGAGGFLLTNYQTELSRYFESGKDLAVYESQEDLLQQIAFYLSHDDIRKEIAYNGEQKMKKYHTYKVRLEKIINTVIDLK